MRDLAPPTRRPAGGTLLSGYLTTHVLDTANGAPASSVPIELWRLEDERTLLKETKTNDDGRTDEPLVEPGDLGTGTYELVFRVGDYFAANDADPPFLDAVPVRFSVADPDAHYHVPLLVSPWSYSTYRGS